MDTSTFETAVGWAADDGEFLLNAAGWDGALTLVATDEPGRSWRMLLKAGTPAGTADPGSESGGGDQVVIRAADHTWDKLLASPPPPAFTDIFGAQGTGEVSIDPIGCDAARHLALRRFTELLRHAAAGTDPAPQVDADAPAHGTHDQAVGRYVHIDLGGVSHRVYYEEAGSGIGLLCQHTAGADGRQWRHLLEDRRVTDHFRVVVYDLPYHGKSLPPESRAWWAEPYQLTQALAMELPRTLATVLGLDRPVFIGSSVGGMLALDLARYHPDDFRAVIALEGGLRVELPEEMHDMEQSTFLNVDPAKHAATMMAIMSPTAPEASRQETRLHYAQGAPGVFPGDILYYAGEHDLRGQADKIDTSRCAVHLLTGEYDFPTVPWTRTAAEQIPGSTMAIMDGLGHFPMSEDHDALMQYVLPLLDGIAAEGA